MTQNANQQPDDFTPYLHNGKTVGKLTKDGKAYVTVRRRDIHLARRHNGYGIQSSIVKDLVKRGVERILVIENAPGVPAQTYFSTPEWWLKDAFVDVLRTADGSQRFLSMKQLREHTDHVARGTKPRPVCCPTVCECVGLGCDHAGTKQSWAHPKGRCDIMTTENQQGDTA